MPITTDQTSRETIERELKDGCLYENAGQFVPVSKDWLGTVRWLKGGGGKTVGEWAYRDNKKIRRLEQLSQVELIGQRALWKSGVRWVQWWAMSKCLVRIGREAFYRCNIQLRMDGPKVDGKREHAFLPPNLKEVGQWAFLEGLEPQHNGDVILVSESMLLELDDEGRGPFLGCLVEIKVLDDAMYAIKFKDYWKHELPKDAEPRMKSVPGARMPTVPKPSSKVPKPSPKKGSKKGSKKGAKK